MQNPARMLVARISLVFSCIGIGAAFYWISFLERVSVRGEQPPAISNPLLLILLDISFPGINLSDHLHLNILLWPFVNGLIYAIFGCLIGFFVARLRIHRTEGPRSA